MHAEAQHPGSSQRYGLSVQEHKDMQTSGEHSSADSASEQETESAATPG